LTAAVMLVFSLSVFLMQRFVLSFLDPIFEVAVIHIPALVASIMYLRKGKASKGQSGK